MTDNDGRPVMEAVELLLTPLDDRDMTELDEWVRGKFVENAHRSLTPDMTPDTRREVLSIAMQDAVGLSFLSGVGASMMGTIDGVARLVWQSARSRQPKLTFEEVKALMFSKDNIREANTKWRQLNLGPGPVTASPQGGPKGKKRQGHRRQKKKSTGR